MSASTHWSDWQRARGEASQAHHFVDWADHPSIISKVFQRAFGRADYTFFDYIRDHLPDWRDAHILSVGCGDGTFETELVRRGLVRAVTGIDAAHARIEAALKKSEGLSHSLHFECRDLNRGDLGMGRFDGAFAKSSLHHVAGLEALGIALKDRLNEQAKLLAIDFFGPSRFQWTDLQLELTNRFIEGCPDRALFQQHESDSPPSRSRPRIEDLIALDPSEAVRSGELSAWLATHFCELDRRALGGTLLNLLFYGPSVNNFVPSVPSHERIIEEAFSYESALIDAGILSSDFLLFLGRIR